METFFERQMKKIFDLVIGASRGGPMRLRILRELSKKKLNANEVTRILGINYKTTEYHLRILKENGLVVETGEGYGAEFSLSPLAKSWGKAHKVLGDNKK
jgi:DNA-binding transcriptional ArsR family regulator